MKITINGKEIDLPQNIVSQIEEAMKEKKGTWKPKDGEDYWYMFDTGGINDMPFRNDGYNKARIPIGNYFPTRELAQKAVDKLKAIQRVKEFIAKEGMEMVGIDSILGMYEIYWSKECNRFSWYWCGSAFHHSPFNNQWFAKGEDAKKVIDNCSQDLKIIWGVE